MPDKVSKFIFPVKTGDTIADKEFELPDSEFSGSYNDLTDKPTLGTASAKDVPSSGNASSSQVVMGNDSRLTDSRNAKDVPSWAKASSKPTYTASEVGAIATSAKGTANGVAELDSSGKVPSSQLPSFVDDTIEGYLYNSKWYKESAHTTEIAGETGKIYVDLSTNKTYRWSGSAFVEISASLALGETSSSAYRGDRGKVAYDHSQSTHARTDATKTEASSTNGYVKINGTDTKVYEHPSGTNPHGTTKSDVGLGNVGNFKAVSTVANQGLSDAEKANARANIGAGTSSLALGTTSSTAAKGDHNHDDRYYTESEVNDLLTGKAVNGEIANDADLNTIIRPGFYRCYGDSTNIINKPSTIGNNHFSLTVQSAWSNQYLVQELSYVDDYTSATAKDRVFRRVCRYVYGYDWKPWVEMPASDHNHDDRYYTESEENQIIDGLDGEIKKRPVKINYTIPASGTLTLSSDALPRRYILAFVGTLSVLNAIYMGVGYGAIADVRHFVTRLVGSSNPAITVTPSINHYGLSITNNSTEQAVLLTILNLD